MREHGWKLHWSCGGSAQLYPRGWCVGTSSMRVGLLGGDLFEHSLVGCLRFVGAVERQCRTPRPMRMGSDPRILVGEAPSLKSCAAPTLQTCPDDGAVNLRLP